MKIAVVGLGLIGGSLAKTIKAKTNHTVAGFDTNTNVVKAAEDDGSIDFFTDSFSDFDLILVSLFPESAVSFMQENVVQFSDNCVVIDCCGVKEYVCNAADDIFSDSKAIFLGGHPMAGREVDGYFNSLPTLFNGASMILTPKKSLDTKVVEWAEDFFLSLDFGKITITTPEHHDDVIAYTSQLAHIVSSAYMQSPTAQDFMGFSAGSFADLTRVAKLNPTMWTELFLKSPRSLVGEIDVLIENLTKYRNAIDEHNYDDLFSLLEKGNDIKMRLNEERDRSVKP